MNSVAANIASAKRSSFRLRSSNMQRVRLLTRARPCPKVFLGASTFFGRPSASPIILLGKAMQAAWEKQECQSVRCVRADSPFGSLAFGANGTSSCRSNRKAVDNPASGGNGCVVCDDRQQSPKQKRIPEIPADGDKVRFAVGPLNTAVETPLFRFLGSIR